MSKKWAMWMLAVALVLKTAGVKAQTSAAAEKPAQPAAEAPAPRAGPAPKAARKPAPAVPDAQDGAAAGGGKAECVPTDKEPCRYLLTLLKVPPSRVWCRFGGESGATVVFDPADPNHATTASAVSKTKDLRCYAEPALRTIQIGDVSTTVDLAWDFDSPQPFDLESKKPLSAKRRSIGFETDKKAIFVNDPNESEPVIQIESSGLPSAQQAIRLLEAHAATAKDGRLFGEDFSAVLKDTLELLAEIAAERAKSKGARLIEQRLQSLLCDELRYEIDDASGRIQAGKSDRGKALLPNLCALIRNVPLAEMVESAPKIARALQLDVFSLGFDLAVTRLKLNGPKEWELIKKALTRLHQVGVQLVASRQFTAKDAQALVLELARDFEAPAKNDPTACDLALAFAVAGICQARVDGCQADDIVDLLREPSEHVKFDCKRTTTWQEASSVVIGLLNVLNPTPEITPRAQYRAAVVLTFDLVARIIAGSSETDEAAKLRKAFAGKVLTHMRALALALFDEETRVAAMHALELVRLSVTRCADGSGACEAATDLLAAVEKITPLLVAFTANAESLKQEAADPEQRKALRQARKETLEAVIDASTQRARRGREHIVSLGANAGVRYGYVHHPGDRGDNDSGNLSLPMGIAYQYLPPSDRLGIGFHSQISFVDLAQFLGTSEKEIDATRDSDSIEWNDFVLVGVQAGVALGTSENAFTLSADMRYFPGGRMQDAWFFGGVATYYVPFFDLN
jgi:hypothetical protein